MSKFIKDVKDIDKAFKNSTIKNVLFISGKNSFYKTKADKFFKNILKKKNKFFYFKTSSVPEFVELKKIINFKEKINPELIIAVGGGCVLDYAKIASNFDNNSINEKKVINSDLQKNLRKKIKLLAIPTTAGSGAEVTSNAVIYINNKKYSVEGEGIKPDYYFLEPRFLQSTNFITDASAGFDAISQAVESMFSLKSNLDSVNYSSRALKILFSNFENFLSNKKISNSYNMALGANLAGKAISISKTTLPHAMSYPFTINYKVPHGHAVSLTFNKFLKFNYLNLDQNTAKFSLKNRFDILFKITKTKNIFELDKFFFNLKEKALLEQNFTKLGINIENDLNKILGGINDQRLKNNPIKVKKKDLKHILINL
jgi:alcohol dehydrogenase